MEQINFKVCRDAWILFEYLAKPDVQALMNFILAHPACEKKDMQAEVKLSVVRYRQLLRGMQFQKLIVYAENQKDGKVLYYVNKEKIESVNQALKLIIHEEVSDH